MACYSGPNPITEEERLAIWDWIFEKGIRPGLPIEKIGEMVNEHFFSGHAPTEWITDIMSGRRTPYKKLADEAWSAAYDRRAKTSEAEDLSRLESMGIAGKILRMAFTGPRAIKVFGHWPVFPVSHAGDLIFRPTEWDIYIRGVTRVYQVPYKFTGGKSKAMQVLSAMESRAGEQIGWVENTPLFPLAKKAGLDAGMGSHPEGLIMRYFQGSSKRSWDMLTVMRYELWEKMMQKDINPEMSKEEIFDIAQRNATWANHATGSAKGPIASLGSTWFGPKLFQSRVSRLTVDQWNTVKTFTNWKNASAGEKIIAWRRFYGATKYVGTYLGALAINEGLNLALHSNQHVNFNDPKKSDWLQFKLAGVEGFIPGLHSELRFLGNVLATPFMTKKELRGESQAEHTSKLFGEYLTNKFNPSINLGLELYHGENWMGRPLPWSHDPGKGKKTRMTWWEFAGEQAPIPLEGPVGYFYDYLRKNGMSAKDSTALIKGLIISFVGFGGIHVQEDPTVVPAK